MPCKVLQLCTAFFYAFVVCVTDRRYILAEPAETSVYSPAARSEITCPSAFSVLKTPFSEV